MRQTGIAFIFASALVSISAQADQADAQPSANSGNNYGEKVSSVKIHAVDKKGTGKRLGEVAVYKTENGLVFHPSITGLSAGMHGFHVHQNPSCQPSKKNGEVTPGGAAGGHYDPEERGHHSAPWGDGHKGDLPALYVDEDGTATRPVLAPRLTEEDLQGASLMIHAGGDNYSDDPKPLGGGGPRVACGVFEE